MTRVIYKSDKNLGKHKYLVMIYVSRTIGLFKHVHPYRIYTNIILNHFKFHVMISSISFILLTISRMTIEKETYV